MRLDRNSGRLWDEAGRAFDPRSRRWGDRAEARGGDAVTVEQAACWLQKESGWPCRVPVGVVGARDATPEQMALAERLGAGLAKLAAVVLCGGREGVMEAVCRGVASEGGVSLGLLPDESWQAANPFVSIPIATGIGEARNAIIARAALCLVAVGGGHGTVSEIALGLKFERPVFGLGGAPRLSGVLGLADVGEACQAVARVLLNLDPANRSAC